MLYWQMLIGVFLVIFMGFAQADNLPTSDRAEAAIAKVTPGLKSDLQLLGLELGAPIFIRIFKQPGQLELWVNNGEQYQLFKRYDICRFSGFLGPKQKEGDWQSPEGFYAVGPKQLNPWSKYHLSFNLGYPNAYDRYHGYTGSALMVHGNCVSIGCYAMTDVLMEEIYTLAHAALAGGQAFFRVQVFPFPLTDENLSKEAENRWYSFWQNLQEGYQHFETHKNPPNVEVENGLYVFSALE